MESGEKDARGEEKNLWAGPCGVTWQDLKAEYLTTDISCRKLAAKYGVVEGTLKRRACREGWTKEKARYRNETYTKALEAAEDDRVARAVRLQDVADKVLQKLEALVDEVDAKEPRSIRALTGALKDLKEIQGVKSGPDEAAGTVEVIFRAGEEGWNE